MPSKPSGPLNKPYSLTKALGKISPAKLLPTLPQSLEPLLPAVWQNLFPAGQEAEKTVQADTSALPASNLPALARQVPLGVVLRQGAFDKDTALNLALFSALAYTGPKSAFGIASAMRSLAKGHIPARYGKRGSIHSAFIARPLEQNMPSGLQHAHTVLFLPALYSLESQFAVQAHIVSNADTAVLFFQGTENLLNIILDSALTPLMDTELPRSFQALLETGRPIAENLLTQLPLGIEPAQLNSFFAHKHGIASYLMRPELQGLHTGFAIIMGAFIHSASFQSILEAHNIAGKRVFCTGHSLGGALAVLMAHTIQSFCVQPVHVYTYGCPRLGEADFVEKLHPSLVHYRLLHNNDPVPWMPDLPAWRAHGQALWLVPEANPGGPGGTMALHVCPPEFSLGRGPFASLQVNPLDHPLHNYVEALEHFR